MSLHNSFKSKSAGARRSVLKRYERLKILIEKKKWKEKDSVFGLPKTKTGSSS
jgi:small basic protein (TIGR04137 family)